MHIHLIPFRLFSATSNSLPILLKIKMAPTNLLLVIIVIVVTTASASRPRPDPKGDPAAFARWLVSEASWCVLTTVEPDGELFGNIISYTDVGTGIPFFYLTTTLDPTGRNAETDPRAAFTISERELGTCGNQDPQSPACSKFCITGKLMMVENNSTEGAFGKTALFRSHPQLSGWPRRTKKFDVFKLIPTRLFLVNDFKPAKNLTVEAYLSYKFF